VRPTCLSCLQDCAGDHRCRVDCLGVLLRDSAIPLGRSRLGRSHLRRSRLGRSRLGRSHCATDPSWPDLGTIKVTINLRTTHETQQITCKRQRATCTTQHNWCNVQLFHATCTRCSASRTCVRSYRRTPRACLTRLASSSSLVCAAVPVLTPPCVARIACGMGHHVHNHMPCCMGYRTVWAAWYPLRHVALVQAGWTRRRGSRCVRTSLTGTGARRTLLAPYAVECSTHR
jgi:hypothetical protein